MKSLIDVGSIVAPQNKDFSLGWWAGVVLNIKEYGYCSVKILWCENDDYRNGEILVSRGDLEYFETLERACNYARNRTCVVKIAGP